MSHLRPIEHALWLESIEVFHGRAQSPPCIAEFLAWLAAEYGIHSVHGILDAAPDREFTDQYMIVMLRSVEDEERWRELETRRPMNRKFLEIYARHYPDGCPPVPPETLTALYTRQLTFPTVVLEATLEALRTEKPAYRDLMEKKFAPHLEGILDVADTSYTIFYPTKAIAAACYVDGTADAIKAEFLAHWQRADRSGTITADAYFIPSYTTEELNENFGGNIAYYCR